MDIEKVIGEIISNQTDKVIIEGELHKKQLEALAKAINQSGQIKSNLLSFTISFFICLICLINLHCSKKC